MKPMSMRSHPQGEHLAPSRPEQTALIRCLVSSMDRLCAPIRLKKVRLTRLEKATQQPNQPVAIAIVEDGGNLISYARMDRCRAIPQRMAIRKAYTAALSGQDTLAYAERLKSQGRTVAEMGDPNLAAVQGGLVVLHAETGTIMGGIGVSGLTAQEDEDIARLGLQTLGL